MGVVNVTKAAVPVLREQGSGHIVQISSVGGRVASPGLSAYQAAKWAVGGFSEVVAAELAPHGVHVTVVEPGGMQTEWAGSSMEIPPVVGAVRRHGRRAGRGHGRRHGLGEGRPAQGRRRGRRLAAMDDPPLRLLLGSDAFEIARAAAARRADGGRPLGGAQPQHRPRAGRLKRPAAAAVTRLSRRRGQSSHRCDGTQPTLLAWPHTSDTAHSNRPAGRFRLAVVLHRPRLDERLARGDDPASDPLLSLRAEQLTSRGSLEGLAIGIERIIEAAEEPPRGINAKAPLRRKDILAASGELRALADTLRMADRPPARRPGDGDAAVPRARQPALLLRPSWRRLGLRRASR